MRINAKECEIQEDYSVSCDFHIMQLKKAEEVAYEFSKIIDEMETKMMGLQQEVSELRAELTRRKGEEIDCV